MVSFENLRLDNLTPIYAQIIKSFKQQCASGQVLNGDDMPSRRMLSAMLSVNPNTVQKAYRMLEEEGLIVSKGGAKSVVVLSEEKLKSIRAELLETEIAGAAAALQAWGASKKEAMEIFARVWDELKRKENKK